MQSLTVMPSDYLALAKERANTVWPPYKQPEQFGYCFSEWVSPYTKGAHQMRGIALVLQDWASEEGLQGGPDPDVQTFGREPNRRTNRVLEILLARVFQLSIEQTYVTNAFPFVKPSSMSSHIRSADVRRTVDQFTRKELEIAKPTIILALGKHAYSSLRAAQIACVEIPHPAARIGNIGSHERAWLKALERDQHNS